MMLLRLDEQNNKDHITRIDIREIGKYVGYLSNPWMLILQNYVMSILHEVSPYL